MTEHEPAARSVALEAVIRLALSNVGGSSWARKFSVDSVADELEGETTKRTVRRALKDAEALGWVTRARRKTRWEPGPKAAEFVDEDTDKSV